MEQVGKTRPGSQLIPTPTWVLVVRIFQIVLSLIVLGLCGAFVHYLYADQLGFAIICCIFTWIISGYNIVAEKVPACRRAYNTYATLALDLFMIIFWLAAMGAVAAYRVTFRVVVSATCTGNGSAVNSGSCTFDRRAAAGTAGTSGNYFAARGALDQISASAGISALIMILFVVSFAYVCHVWRTTRVRNAKRDQEKFDAEMNSGVPPQQISAQQAQPLLNQSSLYAGALDYVPSQESLAQYHQPQDVYTRQPAFSQHGTMLYDPYGQQTVGNQYASVPALGGQNVVNTQEHVYSSYSTPAPGPIYQPPPHY